MNRIEFTKLVATGNDFILVDNGRKKVESKVGSLARFAKKICDRRQSVGADGLLVLEGSHKADIAMRIFNPDGSEASMCGNGSRCIAYYAANRDITGDKLSIETKAGILNALVRKNRVRIGMTPPKDLKTGISIPLGTSLMPFNFVNTGVPHAVTIVKSFDGIDVKSTGRYIRHHEAFAPNGANVDFVKIDGRHRISIRTYERGVEDETLACGTGAVASAIIASELTRVRPPVVVRTFGKDVLRIYFKKENGIYKDVYMEGEVKLVFDGVLKI
ncbi:MAG: diaminopimelate epimerase [Candidatus Omnitrophica bacterium]|nr:diaminopimelate epimerase [Candidatus Omnitrophota bacterium]